MRDPAAIRERYMRDALPIRLGGLAANLARVESFSDHSDHRGLVGSLLEESELFIEWTAEEAGHEARADLAELREQLSGWRQAWEEIWSEPARRTEVARQAGLWSHRILRISGLSKE